MRSCLGHRRPCDCRYDSQQLPDLYGKDVCGGYLRAGRLHGFGCQLGGRLPLYNGWEIQRALSVSPLTTTFLI